MPCEHAYHDECWTKLNFVCVHCYNYLLDSIDKLVKSYNERLEVDNDSDVQDELEISREVI